MVSEPLLNIYFTYTLYFYSLLSHLIKHVMRTPILNKTGINRKLNRPTQCRRQGVSISLRQGPALSIRIERRRARVSHVVNKNDRRAQCHRHPATADADSGQGVSGNQSAFRGFPTRMVYLSYKACLRYTILVGVEKLIGLIVCWLVALRPSNMQVYLMDGSAQTVVGAATLR